ncbi:hypothetical protein ASG01_03415 [Chryseobacterium sp. Leaf180]|uniref:hypothetical protein n=1 Tax=Chryseobacterium sp. Leaf180 TaxID=1736289 RepID=UPI000700B5DF|nr:hypothetical protein [Chryseobacterium sp. Leaf180]KQR94926.1 hypothetical protein ASG01_03415 [Chryseobacterium sp. Leaf180]
MCFLIIVGFENKNVPFLIIFLCFVALCFLISKLLYSKAGGYDDVEKEINLEHANSGEFKYTDDSFRFKNNKSEIEIKYSEILKVSFRNGAYGYKQTSHGLEIISLNGLFYFDQESTNGFIKLIDQLNKHLDISDRAEGKIYYINGKTTMTTVFEK